LNSLRMLSKLWSFYNGPQNLNQLLRDIETAKAKFRFIPKKEVHEKKLQWEV
jgi:hypothetical protein